METTKKTTTGHVRWWLTSEIERALAEVGLGDAERAALEAERERRTRPSRMARRDVGRDEWRQIYREMRCVRHRAMRLLYRIAGVDFRRLVVPAEYLSARVLPIVLEREPSVWREPHMGIAFLKESAPPCYALRIPPEHGEPDLYETTTGVHLSRRTRRWALAALALYVFRRCHRAWLRGALQTFDSAWLEWEAFLAGETGLAHFIGEHIEAIYDRECTPNELLALHRADLARRLLALNFGERSAA